MQTSRGKVDEIKKLISNMPVVDLIEADTLTGLVNVGYGNLTPLGEFVIKLEHILDRDDDLIQRLNKSFTDYMNGITPSERLKMDSDDE